MNKYLKKSILFFTFIVAISVMINAFGFALIFNTENYFKIKNTTNKLFLGDSHTECGINDKLLKNSINISSSADNYFYSFLKLRTLLKHNSQIDTVFLAFGYHNLSDRVDSAWFEKSSYIYHKYPIYLAVMESEDFNEMLKANPKATISANFYMAKDMLLHIGRYFSGKRNFRSLKWGGFLHLDKKNLEIDIENETKKVSGKHKKNQISEREKKYLLKISNLCKEKNKELILLNLPIHKCKWDKYKAEKQIYNDFYEKYLKSHKLLNFSESENLDDMYFSDCTHINYKGAEIFTKKLSNIIRNMNAYKFR